MLVAVSPRLFVELTRVDGMLHPGPAWWRLYQEMAQCVLLVFSVRYSLR